MNCRHLVLVLGDQLDRESAALDAFDHARDRVLMIEARRESTRIRSHKARTALFLAAMRHHAAWLRDQGYPVTYLDLDHPAAESFTSGIRHLLQELTPQRLVVIEPGEYGVLAELRAVTDQAGIELEIRPDQTFLCSTADFEHWRSSRKTLVMEHFYRWMRRRHDVLVRDDKPVGGKWNLDQQNRKSFGRKGPGLLPEPFGFAADDLTAAVLDAVERHFPDNPGHLDDFSWPVTREDALQALDDFITHRLAAFGPYQDAMWDGEPYLYHSLISAALNTKLLRPREVIDAAVAAHEAGDAPLQSVEGFVRQVLGWREYVRGIYWTEGPGYLERNGLAADQPLPAFYWDADTEMRCLAGCIGQTLETGYAHHIQRLMVTGLFAMLFGVRPKEIHEWYLAIYVDAVEWVEAPNVLGMSQHADGGLLGSKPYAASGRYIQRMGNYCDGCRFDPGESTGDRACPFTTLYWDFLIRHEARFADHPRAGMQWRMLGRLDAAKRDAIGQQAQALRQAIG
jgi:deoxyribodipyrimidine photolyase-related protein